MRAVDEVHLSEDRVAGERSEDLRAEGRLLADLDAAVAHDVEVHGAIVLAEDVVALQQAVDARELGEVKELLVFHVMEDVELPQLRGDGDQVVALLRVAGDLLGDLTDLFARVELEEALLAELQALGALLQLLHSLLDARVEVLRLEVLDALEGVDHAAHRLGDVALLSGRQEKRVDEFVERAVEVFQLELDAPGDLGQSFVERVELARFLDLFMRRVPLPLGIVETAEDLEGTVIVRRLQLRDLEQLDGLRRLVLGHVVLRQADVLGRVDLVLRALGVDLELQIGEARLLGLFLEVAHARQVDAQRHRARLELLGHLVQVDGLVVHSLIGVALGQGEEVVGIDGDAVLGRERAKARARRRRDGLLGHGLGHYMNVLLVWLWLAFQPALPGYEFAFPRDHGTHEEYKTEWWYYTGHLVADDGHRYGFELTFFRVGVDRSPLAVGRWALRDLSLAHFAVSDISGKDFRYDEKLNRSSPFTANAAEGKLDVFNEGGSARTRPDGSWRLVAANGRDSIDLVLTARKPPAIHGENGVSVKAEGLGYASHYYSMTRLEVRGRVDGRPCRGLAWMDHEFGSSQLRENQQGWDWFSIQLDNDTELMLYQMRRKDGTPDVTSSGSLWCCSRCCGTRNSSRAARRTSRTGKGRWRSAADPAASGRAVRATSR